MGTGAPTLLKTRSIDTTCVGIVPRGEEYWSLHEAIDAKIGTITQYRCKNSRMNFLKAWLLTANNQAYRETQSYGGRL